MKVPPPSYDESTTAPVPNDNNNVGQYPPSPHFQASMPPQNPPISGHSPIAMDHLIGEHVGPYPQQIFCPTCRQNVVSDVKHISGLFTWILVFLFILFGLFCGCCLLPLCVKSCKDVEHRCPQCYTYLGTYQRVFGTRRNLQRVPGRQI